MKKMKASAIAILSLGMLLVSCGGTTSSESTSGDPISTPSSESTSGSTSGDPISTPSSDSTSTSVSSGSDSTSTSTTPVQTHSITWDAVDGVTFETEGGAAVASSGTVNQEISFVLKIASNYSGNPIVTVNDVGISADSDVYKFTLTQDTVVSVTGVYANIQGTGGSETPYVITSAEQLIHVAEEINARAVSGSTTADFYSIEADIDFKGREITPIGIDYAHRFVGYVDGNGHTIKNFKITKVSEGQLAFGLFGIFQGQMWDLNVEEASIDITVEAGASANSYAYVGAVMGYSFNTFFEGITSSGSIVVDDATPQDSSYSAIVMAGGVVGQLERSDGYYQPIEYIGSSVEIDTSKVVTSYAAGIIGALTTGRGDGAAAVSNSYATGDIKGGLYAAGLVGSIDYFVSISNSFASGNATTSTTLAGYVGGLVGATSYETAIINCFSAGTNFVAQNSTSSYYNSSSGAVTGYMVADGFSKNVAANGTLVYRTYYASAAVVTADITLASGTSTDVANFSDPTWLSENLGWDEGVWTFTNNSLPTLKAYADIVEVEEVDVTLHANYSGGTDESATVGRLAFNPLSQQSMTRDNVVFYDWTYDAAGLLAYRAYVPIIEGIDYYAKWVDYNTVAGKYHGADTALNGYIDIANDGTLVWIKYDGQVDRGTYSFDGTYFMFETGYYALTVCKYNATTHQFSFEDANAEYYTYTFTKADALLGTWVDSNNNILTFDGNGSVTYDNGEKTVYDYVITENSVSFTKTSGDYSYTLVGTIVDEGNLSVYFDDGYDDTFTLNFELQPTCPDYTGASHLGLWHGPNDLYLTLDAAGNAVAKNGEKGVEYFGGYRVYGNRMDVNVFGKIAATLTYNSAKEVFVGKATSGGATVLLSREAQTAVYTNSEDKISLYVCGSSNYVLRNGTLVAGATVSGTIADGEDIVITILGVDYKYTINGTSLEDTPVIVIPIAMFGEWNVNFASTSSLIITEYEVTYNGNACTLVSSTATELVVKFSYVTLTITVVDANTLSVYYDDDDAPISGTATRVAEEVPSILGTWRGSVRGNNIDIVIASEAVVTYNGMAATVISYSETAASVVLGTLEISITYVSGNDTVRVNVYDLDYDEFICQNTVFSRIA